MRICRDSEAIGPIDWVKFGDRLLPRQTAAALTQEWLADRVGVTATTIRQVARSHVCPGEHGHAACRDAEWSEWSARADLGLHRSAEREGLVDDVLTDRRQSM